MQQWFKGKEEKVNRRLWVGGEFETGIRSKDSFLRMTEGKPSTVVKWTQGF